MRISLSETRRKEPEKKIGEEAVARSDPQVGLERDSRLPTGKRKSDHQEDEGRVPNQEGGSSSSQAVTARVLSEGLQPELVGLEPRIVLPSVSSGIEVRTKFGEKKRSAQDLVDRGRAVEVGGQRQDYILPTYGQVTLRQVEKRPADEELRDGYLDGTKQQRKIVLRKAEKREASEEPQTDHPHDEEYQTIDGEDDAPT